jgi:hypothetical protein
LKYSQPVVYVRKEVNGDLGEEDTSILKAQPQFKCLLPLYSKTYEYLGTLQLVTNQPIDLQSHTAVQLSKNDL